MVPLVHDGNAPSPPLEHTWQVLEGDGDALESALCRDVASTRAREPFQPIVVVAASRTVLRRIETRLLHEFGTIVNLRFYTPEDLVASWQARSPQHSPDHHLGLVSEAIQDTLAEGSYFAPLKDHPRLPGLLWRSLTECEAARATPDHLRRAARTLGPGARQRLLDLARLLEACQAARAGRDSPTPARPPTSAPPPNTPAAVLLFETGVPAQTLVPILEDLVDHGVPVRIYRPAWSPWLTDHNEQPPHRWWFFPAGLRRLESESTRPPTLAHLERMLFAPPDDAIRFRPDPEAFQVVSAPDPATEIRSILEEITTLAAQGVPFGRMMVTFRRAEDYASLVEELFAEHDIPFQQDLEVRLATIPVFRAAKSVIDLIRSALPQAQVMALLCSPWFRLHAYLNLEAVREADVFAWDRIARATAARFDDPGWADRAARIAEAALEGGGEDGDPALLDETLGPIARQLEFLRQVVEGLREDLGTFPAQAPPGVYARRLERLLDRLIEARVEDTSPVPDLWRHRADTALKTLKRLIRAQGSLEGPEQGVPWEVFAARLDEACARATVPAFPAQATGGVQVVDLPRLRGSSADHVFLAGMVSSLFPRPDPQDPVLPDAERRALADVGASFVIPDPGLEEKRLLVSAVRAARKRLVVTLHRADSNGRERLPSGFLREIWRAFFGPAVFQKDFADHRAFYREVRHLPTRVGRWDRRWELNLVHEARADSPGHRAEIRLAAWLRHHTDLERAFRAEAERWHVPMFTSFDGIVGPDWTGSGSTLRTSASQLETVAACPFRLLAERVWSLAPLPPRGGERTVSALDRGALYHDILHRIVAQQADLGHQADSGEDRSGPESVYQMVEQRLAAFERTHVTGLPALWAVERRRIQDDMAEFVRREKADTDSHRPFRLEAGFGLTDRDHAPPLRLDVPDLGPVEIVGRIDRLDVDPQAGTARVIDYKTGKAPSQGGLRKLVRSGRKAQPPLYLAAAAAFVPAGCKVSAFYYYHVTEDPGRFSRVGMTSSDLDELAGEVFDMLRVLGGMLQEGIFFPWPDDEACRFCSFGLLCRRSPLARFRRKSDDPRVADYLSLRDNPR